ncbi:DoxX family protein [Novosphingobium sp. KCTC 2891]|uniref:DoxX family protein n=1 Tax=Novosphingobium sp. KCTC 2891 TaxID=2989730 RepID=UPI002222F0FE|nr:DoxX family protein [Novosphingobium sp. KCTC 2891]MCW1382224.1 DoxX family protein [Novosphingobium sp. KCTC 2891]
MNTIAALVGRILLAVIFVVSGINKLFDLAGTETLITGAGLPSGLALPTALFELIGGLAIALGFMTRLFSILFAGFSLVTVLFFHRDFTDPMQATMALKNVAIAGGFLCLFAHSQMRWSYDSMRLRRRGEVATREAEERAREAELRAARAEGQVAGVTTAGTRPATTYVTTDVDGDGVPERRRRWWSLS